MPSVKAVNSAYCAKSYRTYGSWWTCPARDIALKVQPQSLLLVGIPFPPHHLFPKFLLLTSPVVFMKQACSSSFLWYFWFGFFFSFFSQGNSCRHLHCSLYLCFVCCDTGVSLASTTEEIDQRGGGKGRRNSCCDGMDRKSPLQIAFYWERVHCYKLHWEADWIQLHWGLNRFFSAGWQPNFSTIFLQGNVFLVPNYLGSALF